MNLTTFSHSVDNLFAYYQRKAPARGAVDQWFPELSGIPAEAMEEIEAVIKTAETLPRNIPKAYRDGWNSWKHSHPEKIVHAAKTTCNECGGGGFLWYRKKNYSHVCRCAMCDNWQRDCSAMVMPAFTRSQLIEMGVELTR